MNLLNWTLLAWLTGPIWLTAILYVKGDPLANANPAIRFGEGCPPPTTERND